MRGEAEHPEGVQKSHRFAIRREPVLRPLLALFGGTAARSYVVIEADQLHVRYGWLFDKRFRFAEIEAVGPLKWPWFFGIGWRANLVGLIGLTGSLRGGVEVRFKKRRWIWMLLPLPMNRLAVTLEQPDDFIAALTAALATSP
jgi:hypothetical protein